ncbi:MAG: helix-turn-helix domain-containing protein, partial [Oscillospiraceae bacterium]
MDWISGLQRAIDYVEENITEEINFEEVAKRAYSSSFHFQRIFSAICGITLGDYIRFRRLALAGSELSATNAKIIDIALKYGYDSPESFSRAFTKFHGATPSQVKNGACLKSFSRLSVKLIMQGGIMMDYRVEKLDKIKIVCKRERFKAEKELTFEKIPLFWKKCGEDGSIKKLCDMIPKDTKLGGLLGISFSSEFENDSFPYGIGAEYKDGASTEGFEVV